MRTLRERDIEKAIQDAFWFKHRINLVKTDAGGREGRGILEEIPEWLALALGCPQGLPFALGLCLRIPVSFPDLLGRVSVAGIPHWVFIEVKRPGGHFRLGQKEFLHARQQEGHIALWATSVEEALRKFEDHLHPLYPGSIFIRKQEVS